MGVTSYIYVTEEEMQDNDDQLVFLVALHPHNHGKTTGPWERKRVTISDLLIFDQLNVIILDKR